MSFTSARGNRDHYTFDALLELKDAGLVAADAAAQVDSAAKVIDLGTGLAEFDVVVDVSAIEIASNDERYEIHLELSNSSSFASGSVDGGVLILGALEVIQGDTDSTTGRYVFRVRNLINGTIYRYARIFTDVSGTIATGINFSAYAAKC